MTDREVYLTWLGEYCRAHAVDILAYCLVTNHIHLVAVPATETALQRVLKPVHMRYAQRFNRQRPCNGHVWQGRYFSTPLDDSYLWATLRSVERNPGRAELVRQAERDPWSSAAAHCQLRIDPVLTTKVGWWSQFHAIGNWSNWLAEGDQPEQLSVMRRNSEKGLPCGSESFVKKRENRAGRMLHYRPQGRPRLNNKG